MTGRCTAAALAAGVVVLVASAASAADPGRTAGTSSAATVTPSGQAALNLVFVLDGLRPDSISETETPTIARLRRQGVEFTASHAVTPTVTRVNASAIGSGYYPGRSGIVGNAMYVPEVDPHAAFSTGDATQLLRLGELTGRVVLPQTLGERMEAAGKKLVVVGSGSSGSTFLLNPLAPEGTGVLINTGDPGGKTRLAYPRQVQEEVLARFGPPTTKAGVPNSNASVDYATRVLTEYVLPDLKPDVVLTWLTEPDAAQHEHGVGSPEAKATIRNDDHALARVLTALDRRGLTGRTNIFLVSDHGFSLTTGTVDVAGELIGAGLKAGPDSDDVVVAGTGGALVYVKGHDPTRIRKIGAYLQRQPWAGPLYSAARRPVGGRYQVVPRHTSLGAQSQGWVRGTQSLELVHEGNPERGADILVTFPWGSERNAFGVPGTATSAGTSTGPTTGNASSHGSLSPWDVHNTMLAWGVDIKDRMRSAVPAGNVDIAATVLALEGVAVRDELDGRVLREALVNGPDPSRVPTQTLMVRTPVAGGATLLTQVSLVGGRHYVDQSWLRRHSRSTPLQAHDPPPTTEHDASWRRRSGRGPT